MWTPFAHLVLASRSSEFCKMSFMPRLASQLLCHTPIAAVAVSKIVVDFCPNTYSPNPLSLFPKLYTQNFLPHALSLKPDHKPKPSIQARCAFLPGSVERCWLAIGRTSQFHSHPPIKVGCLGLGTEVFGVQDIQFDPFFVSD